MFKKDDYIVFIEGSNAYPDSFPLNYVFKQRLDCEFLSPYLDGKGSKNNGWEYGRNFGKNRQFEYITNWRYATKEEIEEYDRLGKPFDINTLKKKYNFKVGDIVRCTEPDNSDIRYWDVGRFPYNRTGKVIAILKEGYITVDVKGYKSFTFSPSELELVSTSETEENKLEVGKWYVLKANHIKLNEWFLKLKEETISDYKGEAIHTLGDGYMRSVGFCKSLKYTLTKLTNLTEVQQYLPADHPDKIKDCKGCKHTITGSECSITYCNNRNEYIPKDEWWKTLKKGDVVKYVKDVFKTGKFELGKEYIITDIGANKYKFKYEVNTCYSMEEFELVRRANEVKKWSVGTYVVFYSSTYKPKGSISKIIAFDSEENQFVLDNEPGNITTTSGWASDMKWFATLEEAEAFAKTLVEENLYFECVSTKDICKECYKKGKVYKAIKITPTTYNIIDEDNDESIWNSVTLINDHFISSTKEAYDRQNNSLQQDLDKCIDSEEEGICTNLSTIRRSCNEKESCIQDCNNCDYYSLNQEKKIDTSETPSKVIPILITDEPVTSKNTEEIILIKEVKVKPIKSLIL